MDQPTETRPRTKGVPTLDELDARLDTVDQQLARVADLVRQIADLAAEHLPAAKRAALADLVGCFARDGL